MMIRCFKKIHLAAESMVDASNTLCEFNVAHSDPKIGFQITGLAIKDGREYTFGFKEENPGRLLG